MILGISATILGLSLAVSACASSSDEIATAYVSPLTYQDYSCPQLLQEGQRVSHRAAEVAGAVDQKATNDKIMMGVGIVVLWPALLFVKGDGPEAHELARLRGEKEAIEKAAVTKQCGFSFSNTDT